MSDILILGATGYTGQLITQYLADHPDRSSFTLGIAARSQSKLVEIKRKLRLDDSVREFTVDVTRFEQVDHIVQQVKVVINAVGPFWKWGTPVVRACARHGVHYVDLTGEPHWIRDIILEYDYLASKTHSLIIPAAGFDSVPSDLAVYLSNKTLKTLAGAETEIDESISAFKLKGAFSGGTIQTLITALEEVPRAKLQAGAAEYALSTGLKGPITPRHKLSYVLPFSSPPVYGGVYFMSVTNRNVVQRTWGVNQLRAMESTSKDARIRSYGPKFKYQEFMVTSSKFSGIVLSLGLAFTAFCLFIPPIRWLFKQFVPGPGSGPSERQLQKGFLDVTNITSSVPSGTKRRTHVRTHIRGKGDPGYSLAAVMISEAALSILLDHADLPEIAKEGGVLTPASALGDILSRRLEKSGRFMIESEVVLGPGDESRKTR